MPQMVIEQLSKTVDHDAIEELKHHAGRELLIPRVNKAIEMLDEIDSTEAHHLASCLMDAYQAWCEYEVKRVTQLELRVRELTSNAS